MTTDTPPRMLVIIPTFNEVENLGGVVARTRLSMSHAHILVVDDSSPDGTGTLADTLAEADPSIHVVHRKAKDGLGAAYITGFHWGLDRAYDYLVEMDADGSHPPEALPVMFKAAAARVGLVIGSRWIEGGSVENWPKSRELLSRAGNAYARLALGIHVRDATAGFRIYPSHVLAQLDLDSIDSRGYCFQVDLTLRTIDAGFTVVEVPIRFREREFGLSKMSRAIVIEAMVKVTVWGITRRLRTIRNRGR